MLVSGKTATRPQVPANGGLNERARGKSDTHPIRDFIVGSAAGSCHRPIRGMVWALLLGGVPLHGQTGNYLWNGAPMLHPGIRHASLSLSSPRLMKINCLQVDVTTPGIGFKATPRADNWEPGVRETITMTTRQFISGSQSTDKKVVAAINCQPWKMEGSDWNKPVPVYLLLGMAVSDGVVVSPGNPWNHISLVIDRSGTPGIVPINSSLDLGPIDIVCGGFTNGHLLKAGIPSGDNVELMPRTAIGVSQDKRYLYLMTIDGRQPASAGATELEVAEWLRHFGSYEGMNADGGGSTTMAWWDPGAAGTDKSSLLNSPRGDGLSGSTTVTERYVAQNVGVYYDMPVIYWTGHEDRWGGGGQTATADDNFSRLPGVTEWQKVSNGESYHHVYDRSPGAMSGANHAILMNRANNTLGSLTFVADANGNGFDLSLSDSVNNGSGTQLAGPVTVRSGLHSVRRLNEGTNPNTILLAKNSVWNVAGQAMLEWSIPLTGNAGLVKNQSGIAILGGSNSYTGSTVVSGGTLFINGSQIEATGDVTAGGANAADAPTLGGTGTIGGNVTIKAASGGAAGILAPGGVLPGTLTINNKSLILESGSKLAFRLGSVSDRVDGASMLALNGQQWSDFSFIAGTGFGAGTYLLINAASVTGTLGTSLSGTFSGYHGALGINGSNDLVLTVTGDGTAKPMVAINQAINQADPTTASFVNFTVVFSEPVTGFETGDVLLGGTAGATTAVVTGSGTTYNVAVSGMSATGSVIASIAADVVDGGNDASTSTDNTVNFVRNPDHPMWDGGAGTGDWGSANNWNPDATRFGTTADIIFYSSPAQLATFLGAAARTIRSLSFNADADSDVIIRMDNNSTTGRQLIFQSDTGTSTIMVEKGATGNHTIDTTTTGGRAQMNNNLVIDHNGSGTLTIRRIRENSGNNYSLTKTGSGTLVYGNTAAYYYDGPTIISGGTFRFAANDALYTGSVSIDSATLDAATFTDSVGTLDVTGAATINLGSGAAIAFADSSGIDWTGGTLALSGTFVPGSSLRFGTSANGLTATQLGLISAPGVTAFALNENGYLIEGVAGGFSAWQDANSTEGAIDEDHDGDGVSNGIEYFLGGGTNTTGFTALPGVTNTGGALSVTWTKAADYEGDYGSGFRVETSETLDGAWTTETVGVNVALSGNDVIYTFPAGPAKKFVRLVVTGP